MYGWVQANRCQTAGPRADRERGYSVQQLILPLSREPVTSHRSPPTDRSSASDRPRAGCCLELVGLHSGSSASVRWWTWRLGGVLERCLADGHREETEEQDTSLPNGCACIVRRLPVLTVCSLFLFFSRDAQIRVVAWSMARWDVDPHCESKVHQTILLVGSTREAAHYCCWVSTCDKLQSKSICQMNPL